MGRQLGDKQTRSGMTGAEVGLCTGMVSLLTLSLDYRFSLSMESTMDQMQAVVRAAFQGPSLRR